MGSSQTQDQSDRDKALENTAGTPEAMPSIIDLQSRLFAHRGTLTALTILHDLKSFGLEPDTKVKASYILQRFPSVGSRTNFNEKISRLLELKVLERDSAKALSLTLLGSSLCENELTAAIEERKAILIEEDNHKPTPPDPQEKKPNFSNVTTLSILACLLEPTAYGLSDDGRISAKDIHRQVPNIGASTTMNIKVNDLISAGLVTRVRSFVSLTDLGVEKCQTELKEPLKHRKAELLAGIQHLKSASNLDRAQAALDKSDCLSAALLTCIKLAEKHSRGIVEENKLALAFRRRPSQVDPWLKDLKRYDLISPLNEPTPLAYEWLTTQDIKLDTSTKAHEEDFEAAGTSTEDTDLFLDDIELDFELETEDPQETETEDTALISQITTDHTRSPQEVQQKPDQMQLDQTGAAIRALAQRAQAFNEQLQTIDLRETDRTVIEALPIEVALKLLTPAKVVTELERSLTKLQLVESLNIDNMQINGKVLSITCSGSFLAERELLSFFESQYRAVAKSHLVQRFPRKPSSPQYFSSVNTDNQDEFINLLTQPELQIGRTDSKLTNSLLQFYKQLDSSLLYSCYVNGESLKQQVAAACQEFFSTATHSLNLTQTDLSNLAAKSESSDIALMARLLELSQALAPQDLVLAISSFVLDRNSLSFLPAVRSICSDLHTYGISLTQLRVYGREKMRAAPKVSSLVDAKELNLSGTFELPEFPGIALGIQRQSQQNSFTVTAVYISKSTRSESLLGLLKQFEIAQAALATQHQGESLANLKDQQLPYGTEIRRTAQELYSSTGDLWITDGNIAAGNKLASAKYLVKAAYRPGSKLLQLVETYDSSTDKPSSKLVEAIQSIHSYNQQILDQRIAELATQTLTWKKDNDQQPTSTTSSLLASEVDAHSAAWLHDLASAIESGALNPNYLDALMRFPDPVNGQNILQTASDLSRLETEVNHCLKEIDVRLKAIKLGPEGLTLRLEKIDDAFREYMQRLKAHEQGETVTTTTQTDNDNSYQNPLPQRLLLSLADQLQQNPELAKPTNDYMADVIKYSRLNQSTQTDLAVTVASQEALLVDKLGTTKDCSEVMALLRLLSTSDLKTASLAINLFDNLTDANQLQTATEVISVVEENGIKFSKLRTLVPAQLKQRLKEVSPKFYQAGYALVPTADFKRYFIVDVDVNNANTEDILKQSSFLIDLAWDFSSGILSPQIKNIYITPAVDINQLHEALAGLHIELLDICSDRDLDYFEALARMQLSPFKGERKNLVFNRGDRVESKFLEASLSNSPLWITDGAVRPIPKSNDFQFVEDNYGILVTPMPNSKLVQITKWYARTSNWKHFGLELQANFASTIKKILAYNANIIENKD